jgi:hypothetical protein
VIQGDLDLYTVVLAALSTVLDHPRHFDLPENYLQSLEELRRELPKSTFWFFRSDPSLVLEPSMRSGVELRIRQYSESGNVMDGVVEAGCIYAPLGSDSHGTGQREDEDVAGKPFVTYHIARLMCGMYRNIYGRYLPSFTGLGSSTDIRSIVHCPDTDLCWISPQAYRDRAGIAELAECTLIQAGHSRDGRKVYIGCICVQNEVPVQNTEWLLPNHEVRLARLSEDLQPLDDVSDLLEREDSEILVLAARWLRDTDPRDVPVFWNVG